MEYNPNNTRYVMTTGCHEDDNTRYVMTTGCHEDDNTRYVKTRQRTVQGSKKEKRTNPGTKSARYMAVII